MCTLRLEGLAKQNQARAISYMRVLNLILIYNFSFNDCGVFTVFWTNKLGNKQTATYPCMSHQLS